MANPFYPLQAPPTHNYSGNQRDTEDNVLPTTSRTPFPQQLNKLQGKTVKNISPKSPSFALKKGYLEGLKNIGGVLLLVVFAEKSNPTNRKAFYAHLFPFQIENLLREMMKHGQKQKNIPLKLIQLLGKQGSAGGW